MQSWASGSATSTGRSAAECRLADSETAGSAWPFALSARRVSYTQYFELNSPDGQCDGLAWPREYLCQFDCAR